MQHTKNLNMLGAVPKLELQLRLARLGCNERLSEYEGILTSAKRARPRATGTKPVYTLPTAVINYYKAPRVLARTVS